MERWSRKVQTFLEKKQIGPIMARSDLDKKPK